MCVYISRVCAGGVFGGACGTAGQEWWRKRGGRKREGAYCSEVILLDRGFRLARRVRARHTDAGVRARAVRVLCAVKARERVRSSSTRD